jgi:hypothetical protein
MFLLIPPCATKSTDRIDSRVLFSEIEAERAYSTLDDAIDAAIKAGLDLGTAVIEKNGVRGSVNDWIACRIAGGLCGVGSRRVQWFAEVDDGIEALLELSTPPY